MAHEKTLALCNLNQKLLPKIKDLKSIRHALITKHFSKPNLREKLECSFIYFLSWYNL